MKYEERHLLMLYSCSVRPLMRGLLQIRIGLWPFSREFGAEEPTAIIIERLACHHRSVHGQ
jgi:hypothetical protein